MSDGPSRHLEYETGVKAFRSLNDTGGMRREDVAIKLGMSRQAVEQAEKRAIRWIWRNSLRRQLKEMDDGCDEG